MVVVKGFRPMFAGLAVIVIAGLVADWHYHSRRVSAGARADFEWFQGLGFPDVKTRPFVRVATGQWFQSAGNSPSNTFVNAFLLSTNTNNFTVLTVKLSVETFTNTAPSIPEYQRTGFEALELRDVARAEIKRLKQPATRQNSFTYFWPISDQTETFVLAWACWRHGLNHEAQLLYEQAKLLPKAEPQRPRRMRLHKRLVQIWEVTKQRWQEWRSGKNSNPPKPTLRQSVEMELASQTMSQVMRAFNDQSVTRPQLLEKFKAFLLHYPHSKHEQWAKDSIKILERMIAEDRAHAPVDAATLARMPVEQRVRELIFELRDQNGQPVFNNWASVFASRDGSTNTPGHQLAQIGYPAVPQLIEALDSDTFSRTVGSGSHVLTNPHSILTVGDCAVQILDSISRGLWNVNNTGTSNPSRRELAQAWWNELQRKGEKQMLVETVEAGGPVSWQAADRLCERYPDVAIQALTNGIENTSEASPRARLIDTLANLKNPSAEKFLRKEMQAGPELESRIAAAHGLRNLGKPDALDAMIQEWRQHAEMNSGDDGMEELISFLATADSVEAIAALKKDLASRRVEVRYVVVDAIGDKENGPWAHSEPADKPSAATVATEEEFLVSELDDTEKQENMSVSSGNFNYSDPRLCDVAALHLAERWPERYKFDIMKSLRAREHMRIACKNAWLQAHHLPLLPMPPEPKLAIVSRNHSTKITGIEFIPGSAKPRADFKACITRLKGKTFDGDELVQLFTDFVHSPEPACDGLEIEAIKDEDLTGVRISIKLLSGSSTNSSARTANPLWDERQDVTVGADNFGSSSGSGPTEYYGDADSWEGLMDGIEQATSATPETPFSVEVSITKHY